MNNPAHQRLNRHRAVHQPDAVAGGVAVGGGVGQGGAWRRLRAEQAPEGKIVPQGLIHMADIRVDLPQTVLDFLVRVTGIGEGV